MKTLAIALVLLAGCAKKKEAPKTDEKPVAGAMGEAEIKRSQDACKIYVEQVCACADKKPDNADLAKQCQLAKALPDAVRIGLEVAASPDSKPDIVQQSYSSIRKTVAECIEQTAKLPTLGCN